MAKSVAPLLIGAGAIALLATRKKKGAGTPALGPGRMRNGVFVSADCKTIQVADYERVDNYVRGGFAEMREARPELDWFGIAERMFDDTAPNCTGFPGTAESAGVVMLYTTFLRLVAYQMVEERILNAIDIISDERNSKLGEWVTIYGGGPPADLPGNVPEDQVGFSPDFSKSFVGPSWISRTLQPFMAAEAEQGRTGDAAYDRFVNQHNVMVGSYFMPIVQLPMNESRVAMLLERIHEAAAPPQEG